MITSPWETAVKAASSSASPLWSGLPGKLHPTAENPAVDFERTTIRKDGFVYLILSFSQPVAVTDLTCNGQPVEQGLPRTPEQLLFAMSTNFHQSRSDVIVFSSQAPLNEAWLPLGTRGGRYQLGCTIHLAQGTGPEHRGDVVVRSGGPEPEPYRTPELVRQSLEFTHTVVEFRGPEQAELLVNSANPHFPLVTYGSSELEWTLGEEFRGLLATPGGIQKLLLPAAHGLLPLVFREGGREVGRWELDFDALAVVRWVTAGRRLALVFSPEDGSPRTGLTVQPEAREIEPGLYELPLDSSVPLIFSGSSGRAHLGPAAKPALHEFETAYLSLDRGVYQPGEEVICFGWYRTLDTAQRQLRVSPDVPIHLKAPGLNQEVRLSALGAFCVRWRLPEELPPRGVQLEIRRGGGHAVLPLRVLSQPVSQVQLQLRLEPSTAKLVVRGPNVVSLEWKVHTQSVCPTGWGEFQFGGELEKTYGGFGRIDPSGRAELDLTPYSLEHHWMSGTVQAYAQHRTGRAHIVSRQLTWPATAPCVGIRLLRPWTGPGRPCQIEWIVCDSSGRPCPEQRVEFSWEDGDAFAADQSRSEPGQIEVQPPAPDALLRARVGRSQAVLKIPLCGSLELHCDRQTYHAGDRIGLEVSAPCDDAEGVLLCYWGMHTTIQRFRLQNGHARLFLTAEEGMAPDFLARAEIIGPQQTLSATRSIAVSPEARRLEVRLNLLGPAAPGSDLPMEVRVHDHSGLPCPEAEVLLLLLDRDAVERNDHRFEDPLVNLFLRPPERLQRDDNLSQFIPDELPPDVEHQFTPVRCDGWGPSLSSDEPEPRASAPASTACLQLTCGQDGLARGILRLPADRREYRLTVFAAYGSGHFGVAEITL